MLYKMLMIKILLENIFLIENINVNFIVVFLRCVENTLLF